LSIIISIVRDNPTPLTVLTWVLFVVLDGGELFCLCTDGDLLVFLPTNYDFLPEEPDETLVELVFIGELEEEVKVCCFLANLFLLS
jgi:hypothetical protein